jgi:hypothetical protein
MSDENQSNEVESARAAMHERTQTAWLHTDAKKPAAAEDDDEELDEEGCERAIKKLSARLEKLRAGGAAKRTRGGKHALGGVQSAAQKKEVEEYGKGQKMDGSDASNEVEIARAKFHERTHNAYKKQSA